MTMNAVSQRECAGLFSCLDGVTHAGLAVSGGADSTALMHLARRWHDGNGKDSPQFTVLTVDHSLRPGSAREAAWVAGRAHTLGLRCAVLRWTPGAKRSRIQADARQARYDLMAGYAYANGLDALVTAHHLDDQAETLLMRLGRGSGLDGLAGIPERGHWAGLAVLRPFLDVPKARLAATLRALGEDWIEDPSNEDERFERVRLRRAMDELQSLGIGAQALARSARRLRRAREALEQAAGRFLERHASLDEAGFCRIDSGALAAAPEEIALRALAAAIQGVGGRVSPPRMAKLEALHHSLTHGDAAPATLGGCRVASVGAELLILREAGRGGLGGIVLQPGDTALWDNRYRVSIGAGSAEPLQVRALGGKGYGAVRARLGRAVTLPDYAADGLISFWRGGDVVAVPPLGFVTPAAREAECAAEFVNRDLFLSGR